MVKIKLNDDLYRYDVYQMFNLFYSFTEIEFTEDIYDFLVIIDNEKIVIKDADGSLEDYFNESINYKEQIKKTIFIYLSEKTKIELPWGTLVGIRPSKIALSLMDSGYSESEIIEYYKKHYFTREDKIKLCIEIAKAEKNIVNTSSEKISIYIGMPFCPSRCLYCSFTSSIGRDEKLVNMYIKALLHEIESIGQYINDKALCIDTIYFGGGTPTAVSDNQFEDVMSHIYKYFADNKNVSEFTVECGRPDSLNENKFLIMKKYGVTRISINPQTMNDESLKKVGRNHTSSDIIEKYNMARDLGFNNINMDLIAALPGEDVNMIEHTCNEIQKLSPDSITVHGLCVKRGSALYENILNNNNNERLPQSEINKMYERTVELSKNLKMKPYYMYRQKNMIGNMENVGYSLTGKEGIYNIQMIEEKQTIISVGANAVTKVVFLDENRIERFANVKDVKEYVNRIDEMINKKIELLNTLY
ncbi:MAG: coproporphyrinogen III oxidase [Bacillota bacterium]|nr:coproporphyrinogen III oxidase [Bacillota bacterium]